MKTTTCPVRKARRRFLLGVTSASGLAAVPTAWHKPVVDFVFLPAHAQASQVNFGSGVTVRRATSELRTPSGSGDVEALATLSTHGCAGIPNAPVSCVAQANLGSGVMVPLGTSNSATNVVGRYIATFSVPLLSVAPVTAIVDIQVTCTVAGVSASSTLPASAITAAIGGTGTVNVSGIG